MSIQNAGTATSVWSLWCSTVPSGTAVIPGGAVPVLTNVSVSGAGLGTISRGSNPSSANRHRICPIGSCAVSGVRPIGVQPSSLPVSDRIDTSAPSGSEVTLTWLVTASQAVVSCGSSGATASACCARR